MQRRWSTSNYIIMCLSGTGTGTCIRTVFGFWGGTINGRVHSSTYIRVYNYGRCELEYVLVSTVEKIKTNSLGLLKRKGTQEIKNSFVHNHYGYPKIHFSQQ